MRKMGTIWVDFCPGLDNADVRYLVKRTEGTMVHDPDELLKRSEISSLISRGYKVVIDKRK
jgi:hypothetical protein